MPKKRFKKKSQFLTKIKQKFQSQKECVKNNENIVDNKNNNLSKEDKLKKIESFISTKSVELESLDPQIHNLNLFHKQHKKGFVDVWWLYDDGGELEIKNINNNNNNNLNRFLRIDNIDTLFDFTEKILATM